MQGTINRKEAIRKFKERKPAQGTYVVRCSVSGSVWVGASRNLDATRNGLWFSLRNGANTNPSLLQEWNQFGEQAFDYQILETLEEDLHPLAVADLLKAKRQEWVERLQARPLL